MFSVPANCENGMNLNFTSISHLTGMLEAQRIIYFMISTRSDLANDQKHARHPLLILVVCLLILGIGAAAGFKLYSRNTQHQVAIPTSGNLCGTTTAGVKSLA